MRTASLLLLGAPLLAVCAAAHEGPDPLAHWVFNQRAVRDGVCSARLGPDLTLAPTARLQADRLGDSLGLTDEHSAGAISDCFAATPERMPRTEFTVSAWFLIDEAESNGTLAGVFAGECEPARQEQEDYPAVSWRLGYNDNHVTFDVETVDGGPTQIVSRTPYEKGQWTHVAVVYDGASIKLFVNGALDSESERVHGPIRYANRVRVALGGTPQEGMPALRGRLREVSLYNLAARAAWVKHVFAHLQAIVTVQPAQREDSLSMVVDPYLQYGTTDSMTVMWQTSRPGSSVVRYGADAACSETLSLDGPSLIHEVTIKGLEPEAQYFYRVETESEDGASASSGVSTFTTAVLEGTPFAFAVISDTQGNPVVASQLSRHAWAQRPSFLLHPGDLVSTGVNDTHWTQHFFPGMRPLISRVPFYPVLGNHEQNARNYYDYVSLPNPEYYYDFKYGDAHFFMIDTNRNVGPGSEQYEWLEESLAASEARWKFACHHHPPYSSDENDYGDLWQTRESKRGDLRARQLCELYERHNVDLVWNGHIHSYERTWPVRENRAIDRQGPVYMIVGGGGGGLETPGPYRPFFQNQVRRGHHYVMAHLNGGLLEVRSYDLEDRLFDTFTIDKRD